MTINDVLMKILIQDTSFTQILFLRSLIAAILLLFGISFVTDVKRLFPRSWKGTIAISLLQAPALLLFPFSLYYLPLTTALILVYSSPIFVVFLAPLFSGQEKPGPRRIAAVCAGFVGAAIVINPSFDSLNAAMLLPVICALFTAVRDLATYQVTQSSHPLTITLTSLSVVMVLSAALTITQPWEPLSLSTSLMVFGAAAFIALGQLLLVMALMEAAAYIVATLKYTSIIWSVMLSYLLWSELPYLRDLIGGTLIIAGGIAIVRIRSGARTAFPSKKP